MSRVASIDFHVTGECSQECAYCWGPQEDVLAVDSATARAIVDRVARCGVRRIVFTGGDPLARSDLGQLVQRARAAGLEVALSTTGDRLTAEFLRAHGDAIDLVSLPLDGPSEEVNRRTKKEGHFGAVMAALDLLAAWPRVDVKIGAPVTRHNLAALPALVQLLEARAARQPNRFFLNVFQVFPRATGLFVPWPELVVSDEDFATLRQQVEAAPHALRIHWLDHQTLDRLYVMIFPDGTLTIPVGAQYRSYGPFLQLDDLDAVLDRADFDVEKHQRHAAGWQRAAGRGG